MYKLIICGGTFDRLHAGHKAFLRFAFQEGEKVIIGITSDKYVLEHKKNATVLPFFQRKKEVEDFLRHEGLLERATIVAIDSRFDQTQMPESASVALLVTQETASVGEEINKKRQKDNLSPLHLLLFPYKENAQGEKISSSAIREGMMTREGILLPDKNFLTHTLYVSASLREILHHPFGKLFTKEIPQEYLMRPEKIVSVGDVTTKKLHDGGIKQKLSVVDFVVERQKTNATLTDLGFSGDEKVFSVASPAGQLTPAVWQTLLTVVKDMQKEKNLIVTVNGEEDLLVIPLVLLLPLGFSLFYGQPGVGVVLVEITEEIKHQIFAFLRQFVAK